MLVKYAQYCAVVTAEILLGGYRKETIAPIRGFRPFCAEQKFYRFFCFHSLLTKNIPVWYNRNVRNQKILLRRLNI